MRAPHPSRREFGIGLNRGNKPDLLLYLAAGGHGLQPDSPLTAFCDTSSATDAARRIHQSGLFEGDGLDRAGGLASAAADAYFGIDNGNGRRIAYPLLHLADAPIYSIEPRFNLPSSFLDQR